MGSNSCSIEECERLVFARDLCRAHWYRDQRYGDPLGGRPVHRTETPECSVEGCTSPHYAGGWCSRHWQRNRKYGDPLGGGVDRQPRGECSVDDCDRSVLARGWCHAHYYRAQRNDGDPLAGKPLRAASSRKPEIPRQCEVEGCESPHYARGMCMRHHGRWRDYGDPEAPLRRARNGEGWRGINNNGYVVLKLRGKVVLEHRQVMEQVLGRPLFRHENIHHVNGDKTCNTPENLEIWVKVQPSGQRLEDLIAFIAEYYPEQMRAALSP